MSGELQGEELFDADALAEAVGQEAAKCSARYVRERNPKLYNAVKLALSYGIPKVEIARRLPCSQNLVRAIEYEELPSINEAKKSLTKEVRRFALGAINVLNERIDEIKLEALMVGAGIMIDKLQLLEGQATQIVEHRDGGVSADELIEKIRAAQAAAMRDVTPADLDVIDGRSVSQPEKIGNGAGPDLAGLAGGDQAEESPVRGGESLGEC